MVLTFIKSASAQNLVVNPSKDVKIAFAADLKVLNDNGVSNVTSKYDGMTSASISFNRQKAVLTVIKGPADCSTGSLCSMSPTQILEVSFQVKAYALGGCYENYYAQSIEKNSVTGAEIKEELWIKRYMSEVCQSILPVEDGELVYKVTGSSNESTSKIYGSAKAILENIKLTWLP